MLRVKSLQAASHCTVPLSEGAVSALGKGKGGRADAKLLIGHQRVVQSVPSRCTGPQSLSEEKFFDSENPCLFFRGPVEPGPSGRGSAGRGGGRAPPGRTVEKEPSPLQPQNSVAASEVQGKPIEDQASPRLCSHLS